MLGLLKAALKDFADDECPRMAASMSYFTVFSLAPLLVLVLMVVGLAFDPADVQGRISAEVGGLIGAEGAKQIDEMIVAANRPANRGAIPTVLGALALLFGATGAFGELQSALNKAWEVKPDPKRGGVRSFLVKRLLSLGMVATIAFLLLVSLVVSAALTAFGDGMGTLLGGVSEVVLQGIQLIVSLVVITALFAVMFKVLPDAVVAWKDAAIGAAFTTVLFVAGKTLIGFYLSKSNPGSAFGTAGALAVIMVWIYFSAMIVFLGAEFTQVWAVERGSGVVPEKGAIRTDGKAEKRAEKAKEKSPAGQTKASGAPYP